MTSDPNDRVLEKNVESLLGSAGDPPVIDPGARARIRAAVIAKAAAPARAPRRTGSPLMIAGGALIAAATVAAIVHHVRAPGDQAARVVREGDRIELPDGTVAVLGEGGSLDTLGARRVRVGGQVYLDVAPGKGRFVVETAHGTMAVLGTRFVVAARADDTTAAVVRGAVQLRSGGAEVVVRAGELGTMRAGAPPTRGPAPRLSAMVGWARERRARDEQGAPQRRSGTLYARDPQLPDRDFPLPMRALTVDVVVENQVARVALDQTFHNPRPETLEGVYRLTVPPDAALSRLAMYVDGTLMESAVVERMQARRIYEDIVYKRRDPALAEWTGAGRIDLRVFPLPGGRDKRLIAAYTQPLPRVYDDWTLTVPLPDLDATVDEMAIHVKIADCADCEIHSPSHEVTVAREGDAAVVSYRKAADRLGDSLVLTVRDRSRQARVARHADGADQYLLVRARPDLGAADAAAYRPRSWVILDDVSASRGELERRAQADLIDKLIDTIDEDDRVAVASFDVAVRRHGGFVRAADVERRAVRRVLLAEGGVGATDLGAALDDAAAMLAGVDPRDAYVVYVGDGVVTGGARDLAALRGRIAGRATFVGFAVGDGADVPGLGALADATGGLVVPIDPADDLAWRALDAVAVLYTPRVVGVRARVLDRSGRSVAGAIAHLRGGALAEGDEVELVMRAPAGADVAAIALDGIRAGRPWSQRIDLASATAIPHAGYLPRLWAQRQIASLTVARNSGSGGTEDERIAHREALRKQIVALGTRFFLLSPHTSLIVLENDAMYREYGVAQGHADGWAPYAAPATIAVTATAPTSFAPDDGVGLIRTPVEPFSAYPDYQYDQRVVTRGTIGAGSGGGRIAGNSGVGLVLGGDAKAKSADKEAEKREPTAAGLESPLAEDRDDNAGPVAVTTAAQPAAPPPPPSASTDVSGWISTAELGEAEGQWQVGYAAPRRHARARRVAHAGKRGGGGWIGQPNAIAWNYAADWRLDDLTGFVPAFFADDLDDAIAELHAAGGGRHGSIDDAARALLVSARRRLAPGVHRWADGPAVEVDAADRMRWTITHDTGLVEELRLDGTTLHRRYPELGLDVTRALGDDTPALLLSVLPLVPPDPDHLARWYVVTRKDAHTIALAAAADPTRSVLELVFDAADRLVALRTPGGRTLDLSSARGGEVPPPVAGDAIKVTLPLRPPAYWRNQLAALGGASVGGGVWRSAQRNLLASLAATQDASGALATLRALKAAGGVTLGDLVLASGALGRGTGDRELIELLAGAGDAGRVVGRYLSAARAYGKHPEPGIFAAVRGPAGDAGAHLIAALAQHRETLALVERGKLDAALSALRGGQAPSVLRVIAATQIAAHAYYDRRGAEAWEAVADGAWKNVARYEAARMLAARGDSAGAARRFVELMASIDPDATPITLDWTARSAITYSARGEVGWQLAWSAYRNAILDRGDLDDVLGLLASAMQVAPADVDRVIGRAAALAQGDPDAIAEIVGQALAVGRVDRAAPLLDAALAHDPTPDLLRLASTVAERQGRVSDAADLLDRALAADGDGPVPLSQLRAELGRLLDLRGRVAMLATGAARETAVDAALAVAAHWRDLDPDYAALDQQIGRLLLSAGRRDEAWRQLSTAIERHPMEGDGWALVAGVMEQEGRLDEALAYWQQAIVIDQTNPTWRMRKAQALFALGRDAEARALLEEISARSWHARWTNIVWQVKQMLQADRSSQRR